MANYRRYMNANEQKHLLKQFQHDIETRGGIFTPAMRRRLLGVRGEKNQAGKPDTADFWQDVRDYTKAALRDLELLTWVAEDKQLQDIFAVRDLQDWDEQTQTYRRPDPTAYINMLIRHDLREEWHTRLGFELVGLVMKWCALHSKTLQNPLLVQAFENANSAAELLRQSSPR